MTGAYGINAPAAWDSQTDCSAVRLAVAAAGWKQLWGATAGWPWASRGAAGVRPSGSHSQVGAQASAMRPPRPASLWEAA